MNKNIKNLIPNKQSSLHMNFNYLQLKVMNLNRNKYK